MLKSKHDAVTSAASYAAACYLSYGLFSKQPVTVHNQVPGVVDGTVTASHNDLLCKCVCCLQVLLVWMANLVLMAKTVQTAKMGHAVPRGLQVCC